MMDNDKDIDDIVLLANPNYEEIGKVRECSLMFYLCLSQILTQASIAQTIVIVEKINETFKVTKGEMTWFTAAYSMTVGTFILMYGKLGDRFGYKNLLVIGYFCFSIFTILCGISGLTESTIFLSIMRGLQGMFGPAIIMPNTQAIIGSYYPDSFKKDICLALFGAVAPTGFIIGALFSSMFAMLTWWPWTFWTSGIVCMILHIFGYFIIPKHIGMKTKIKFDYWGTFFGTTGLILINFAFNQGANIGWTIPYVYILFIVGVLCMVVFVYIEHKVENGLIPLELLNCRTCFILVCVGAGWSCFGIWLNYTFRWAIHIDKDTSILASVKNVPVIPSGFMAAILTPWLLSKLPSSCVLFISTIAFLLSIILMGTRPVGQIYWAQKFISVLIMPIALDTSYPAASISLSNFLPKENQGIASSLVLTSINYSVAIGLGFSGAAEKYITLHKPTNNETKLLGFRTGLKVGIGLAGFAVLLSIIFMYMQIKHNNKGKRL
ncbi:unnamed protein product [Candida verbasci]|uniref:Major facilitator superfamily (MFS) profile domain-containing protein n=1 Tax=Candida verbasci TaxID=1227364 RepID=A0A9W4TU04_9ASCO|nr:unnamed protein product [Candida verbasci]